MSSIVPLPGSAALSSFRNDKIRQEAARLGVALGELTARYWHFLELDATWGEPYRPPAKPPPGFGLGAGTLMVEAYGTVDPMSYVTPPPMSSLSYRSKLIELVSSGKHHDVTVDEISRLRLIAWVDAMCPYMGDDEVREIPDPVFQGVDWLAVRPKIKSAPRITRPRPMD